MKERVGIVTITELQNYGNRLQNYAVQEFLNDLGYVSETINQYSVNVIRSVVKKILFIIGIATPLHSRIINIYSRQMIFERFNKKYIKFAACSLEDKNLEKYAQKYKYVVCGSDQIWNPYFNCGKDDHSFLTFVEPDKRIGLCASFGCESIPKEQEQRYRRLLNGMRAISVREDKGKEMIEKLAYRNKVQVFLDPVFWINVQKWDSLASSSTVRITEKYMLVSYVDTNRIANKDRIEAFARKENLKVVYLQEVKNKKTYLYGPCEFLYLIKNAELVLTDSFHATAFSIIYRKCFFVLEGRNKGERNMDSRLNTLLEKFSLSAQKIISEESIKRILLDYGNASGMIEANRSSILEFLRKL